MKALSVLLFCSMHKKTGMAGSTKDLGKGPTLDSWHALVQDLNPYLSYRHQWSEPLANRIVQLVEHLISLEITYLWLISKISENVFSDIHYIMIYSTLYTLPCPTTKKYTVCRWLSQPSSLWGECALLFFIFSGRDHTPKNPTDPSGRQTGVHLCWV